MDPVVAVLAVEEVVARVTEEGIPSVIAAEVLSSSLNGGRLGHKADTRIGSYCRCFESSVGNCAERLRPLKLIPV